MSDGDQVLIEDQTGGLLGRNVWHDPRNREYPTRGVVFEEDAPVVARTWALDERLPWNQLRTSSCTIQAASGALYSEPSQERYGRHAALAYHVHRARVAAYEESRRYDPWPGEDYDGTSTDAPLKLMRARNHIAGWRWCFGIEDVLRTLSHHGPVLIGVSWHEGMFDTDAEGYIRPTGPARGGHAVMLHEVDDVAEDVIGPNSWGDSWGEIGGFFRLRWDDLEALLEADGEAATITEG